jgi:hypothetical protein
MAGLCYVMPVTGHKAYTGKEEEEDNLFLQIGASNFFYLHQGSLRVKAFLNRGYRRNGSNIATAVF